MERPDRSEEDWIRQHEQIITMAAWRLTGSAEYDDLYQEGMISVWLLHDTKPGPKIVSAAVYNRLIDWVRYINRLQRLQSVSYEEALGGIHDVYDGEHA